jgi:hypothetical protein
MSQRKLGKRSESSIIREIEDDPETEVPARKRNRTIVDSLDSDASDLECNSVEELMEYISKLPAEEKNKKDTEARNRNPHSCVYYFFTEVDDKNYQCMLRPEKERSGTHIHNASVAGPVTNLWQHLSTWHPKSRAALDKGIKDGENLQKLAKQLIEAWNLPMKSQTQISQFLNVSLRFPDKLENEMLLLLWAVHSGIPFNCFSSPYWKKLCDKLGIQLCGADVMMSNRLPILHHYVKDKVHQKILKAPAVAVAIDGWDSGSGKMIGIAFQYILVEADGRLRMHCDLDYVPTIVSQTGVLLDAVVWGRITNHLGDNTLLSSVVTDNGSNYRSAAKLLCGPEQAFPCMAHTMQLVFSDVQGKNQQLKDDLNNIQAIVTTIRNTQTFRQYLADKQNRNPPLQLVAPVATWWSSTFYMLERFVLLLEPLAMIATERDLWGSVFNTTTLDRIRSYVPVLKLLENFTRIAEGDYVTISLIPNLLHSLINEQLSRCSTDSTVIKQLKKQIKESIKGRMEWILQGPSLPLLGAALDPRYGHLSFIEQEVRDLVWDRLAHEGYAEMNTTPAEDLPSIEFDDIKYHLEKVRKHFEANIAPVSSDPLKFWQDYKPGNVILPIVQMVLAIPASSAAVERGFSNSGFLLLGRENLSLDHVEQLSVVRNYLHHQRYNFSDLCHVLQKEKKK